MAHITDYEKVKDFDDSALFVFDQNDKVGTRSMFARDMGGALLRMMSQEEINDILGEKPIDNRTDLLDYLDPMLTVADRKLIYRGRNLGTEFTEEQKTAIAAGTFRGLFLGDYWVIGDVKHRIVDFDYWYNIVTSLGESDQPETFKTHHLCMWPDNIVSFSSEGYTFCVYHTGNSLESVGTKIPNVYASVLSDSGFINSTITDFFGPNILSHPRISIVTIPSNDYSTWSQGWDIRKFENPDYMKLFGYCGLGRGDNTYPSLSQIAICGLLGAGSKWINEDNTISDGVILNEENRVAYWLDEPYSQSLIGAISWNGTIGHYVINNAGYGGIRPLYAVG